MSEQKKGLTSEEVIILVGKLRWQIEVLEKECALRDQQIEQLRAELSEARKANGPEETQRPTD